ncbi:MAG: alpha/beta hydrolase family protein [Promethearchaeota archaeon]
MYRFPLSVSTRCPHCGRKLGLFRKLELCALTGETVCTKCIKEGRFSDSVWDKIPKEFQQKYRGYNWVPFLIFIVIGLFFIQSAFWKSPGWYLSDLNKTLYVLIWMIVMMAIGIGLLLASIRLPLLGSWLFYKWIGKPENKKKVEDAMKAMEDGTYTPSSRMFLMKQRLFSWLQKAGYPFLLRFSLIINIAFIPLYYIVRFNISLAGTYFSLATGILTFVMLCSNFLTIIVASAFYCHKNKENQKQKKIIELLSWLYVGQLPFLLFSLVLGVLAGWDISGELPPSLEAPLLSYHQFSIIITQVLAILLDYYLITKANPNYNVKENAYPDGWNRTTKRKVKIAFREFATLLSIIGLMTMLFLALLTLAADVTMALCVLSSIYIQFGLAIPLVFVVLKLARRKPHRYNQPYWTLVKISLIIIGINAAPLIGTMTWTNWTIEQQFSDAFGANWNSKIPADLKNHMRQVPFSFFDAFFGFDIKVNARYTIPYFQDSPRYVRSGNTILSNGSSKYSAIVDTFVFDAYLPSWAQFGGNNSEKFPVIMFLHGVGMKFGAENANLTSQYLANQGYLVCDMMYGFSGWTNNRTGMSGREARHGYDAADMLHHLGAFTYFLENNSDFYHADLNNFYVAGRSFGGWLAPVIAYGYNSTFFGTNFSNAVTIRGCIPYYGAHGIPEGGSDNFLYQSTAPEIRGSSDPTSPDYNPEWDYMDPLKLTSGSLPGVGKGCPTFAIHGTNDFMVPPGWSRRLINNLKENGQIAIGAFYPLGSHGFDAAHWNQYGQSIIYYLERFLALTRN